MADVDTADTSPKTGLKVAIVCDWLLGIGGAERVVLELHNLYPEAPIFTSQYDPKKIDWFEDADVRTGWLQKLPGQLKKLLPVLRAWYFSRLDLSDYDLVISSSGAEAKAVKTGPKTLHICYCHAPTHYYWIRYDEYLANPGWRRGFNWLGRLGLKLLVEPMRQWDRRASGNPDVMLANSTHTSEMIKKYYKRDTEIVFPPVDVGLYKATKKRPRHGFLAVGRQTPYKRIDLAVEACTQLDQTLVVIGNGPDHKKLEKLAGRNVTFLTNTDDAAKALHMQTALALIFPSNIEDFGVTGVEALAAGTPVIAYAKGGPRDFVIPGKTGELFEKQTVKSLVKVLENFKPDRYKHDEIAQFAQQFSVEQFHKNIRRIVRANLNQTTL